MAELTKQEVSWVAGTWSALGSPRWAEGEFLAARRNLEEAFGVPEKGAGKPKSDQLNQAAWDLAELLLWIRIVQGRDQDRPPSELFTTEERLFLDFGLLDMAKAAAWHLEEELAGAEKGGVRIQLLHHLADQLSGEVFRAPELLSLRDQIAATEGKLAAGRKNAQEKQQAHCELLRSMANGEKLLELQEKLDDVMRALAEIEASGIPLTPETHRRRQRLMELCNRLRQLQDNLIDTYIERKDVKDSYNQYTQALVVVKRHESELARLKQRKKALIEEITRRTPKELLVELRKSFRQIQDVLRLINRQEKDAVPGFILEERPNWLPSELARLLGDVLVVDEKLGQNWSARRWELPEVVALPGSGPALYDRRRNTIWVPVVSAEEGFSSFVRALGTYRFFQARGEQESFGRLDPFRDVRTTEALSEAFARTYETYVMREARGFRKLPPEVRKWFRTHLLASP